MIGDLLAQWHGIFMFRWRCIQRIRYAFLLGLTKVIDQQVTGDGRHPGHERRPLRVIGFQAAIHFDEDFLGEVLRLVWRAGKAIADVIDAPVVALHNLLPSGGLAGNAATDEQAATWASSNPTPGTTGERFITAIHTVTTYVIVRRKVRGRTVKQTTNCSSGIRPRKQPTRLRGVGGFGIIVNRFCLASTISAAEFRAMQRRRCQECASGAPCGECVPPHWRSAYGSNSRWHALHQEVDR